MLHPPRPPRKAGSSIVRLRLRSVGSAAAARPPGPNRLRFRRRHEHRGRDRPHFCLRPSHSIQLPRPAPRINFHDRAWPSKRFNVSVVIHTFSVTELESSARSRCWLFVESRSCFSFAMRPCSSSTSAISFPSSSDISTTCRTRQASNAFQLLLSQKRHSQHSTRIPRPPYFQKSISAMQS